MSADDDNLIGNISRSTAVSGDGRFLASSAELGLNSHNRRVAALAMEIAARIRLPKGAPEILEMAATAHHYPVDFFEMESINRLMTDLIGPRWRNRVKRHALSADVPAVVKRVVDVMQGGAYPENAAMRMLSEIVEISNLFSEQVEWFPYEPKTVDQMIDEIRTLTEEEFFLPEPVRALANLPRARREELLEIVYRMPMFPAVALSLLDRSEDEDEEFRELNQLVASDPALAAGILRVANSSQHGSVRAITSLREAIGSLGIKSARKLVVTSMMRPNFAAMKAADLWRHSIEMAQVCERLAIASGVVDPREGFLAGLVHDVGRLAMERLGGEARASWNRMMERGCEPVFVEKVLCRFDHADLGWDILLRWNFPPSLLEGVKYHHEPERSESPHAALLYLGEYWTDSQEDLPSARRLEIASERTGIDLESLPVGQAHDGLLDALGSL
jgi:HD-like signal output (HDOD) protein